MKCCARTHHICDCVSSPNFVKMQSVFGHPMYSRFSIGNLLIYCDSVPDYCIIKPTRFNCLHDVRISSVTVVIAGHAHHGPIDTLSIRFRDIDLDLSEIGDARHRIFYYILPCSQIDQAPDDHISRGARDGVEYNCLHRRTIIFISHCALDTIIYNNSTMDVLLLFGGERPWMNFT